MAARPRVESVVFSDFEWKDPRTGVSVVVHGEEVHSIFEGLAEYNGVPVDSLLQNSSIVAGARLTCPKINRLPPEWSWQVDSEGYLLLKLRQSSVPRGHGFLGDGDDGSDYELPKSHKRRQSASSGEHSTPQHSPRAKRQRACSAVAPALSPASPKDDSVGCNQPVQIRLHRLAFMASCGDRKVDPELQIRHICGHKRCAMVSHFRPGDGAANQADKTEHRSKRGCSRQSFGPPQP